MKIRYVFAFAALLTSLFVALSRAQTPEENVRGEGATVFPKGDEKKGRLVFEVKRCYRCHTISGEKFPEIDLPAIDNISLGGPNNAHWTRDEYAHNIMAPQHIISPDHQKAMLIIGDRIGAENSPMPPFIDALTVRDLIDLASYLESISAK